MPFARARYVRFALTVGAVVAAATLGGASAEAQQQGAQVKPAFKVVIHPAYATANQSTTFQVTVVNTSSQGTALKSLQLTPPTGFTLSRPGPGAPLRRRTKVHRRLLSVHQISVSPGSKVQLDVVATAPNKCGKSLLRWTSRAFQGATGSGPQFALQSALSSTGVTVLCPSLAVCGDGGPPCSTSLTTSVSIYGVVSNAGSGTLRQTLDVGRRLTCGSYRFRDPNWYDSLVTSPSSPPTAGVPPVMDQVSYTIKNSSPTGVSFCLGAQYEFTTASGNQARAGKLPNGNAGFTGLLPLCANAGPPCISTISQQSDPSAKSGYDVVMSIQIPDQGDPWGGS